jgi:hypothetical protein
VKELILGHPDRIKNELGMSLHVFLAFVTQLRVLEEELGQNRRRNSSETVFSQIKSFDGA